MKLVSAKIFGGHAVGSEETKSCFFSKNEDVML